MQKDQVAMQSKLPLTTQALKTPWLHPKFRILDMRLNLNLPKLLYFGKVIYSLRYKRRGFWEVSVDSNKTRTMTAPAGLLPGGAVDIAAPASDGSLPEPTCLVGCVYIACSGF